MENNERPILDVLQQIQDGSLNAKVISRDVRQQCIQVLMGQGYTEAAIAKILCRSDRTVRRDILEIQRKHAMGDASLQLAKEIIGDMFQKAKMHHSSLVRLARGRDATVGEKIVAEGSAWKIINDLIMRLQSLRYLPQQQAGVDLYHHLDTGQSEVSFGEMKDQLAEIEKISGEHGGLSEESAKQVSLLRKRIEKEQINEEIINLNHEKQEVSNDEEKQTT